MRARFGEKTYEWTLTYRGGPNRCDILLTNASVIDAAGKMIPYVTGKPAKTFRFDPALVESSYRDFYRQWDAQAPPVGSGQGSSWVPVPPRFAGLLRFSFTSLPPVTIVPEPSTT